MIIESYDVLILSDLHLGSENSKATEAFELLRSKQFRKLILLGDIFCDLNFRRLKRDHWDFLSYIRMLSNPKRGVEVIWVEGNHDYGLVDVMSHLVGVPAYREYAWESEGIKHLAIHGHQFDSFVIRNCLLLNGIIGNMYLFLQKLTSKGRIIARMLDRLNTHWQRLTPKVAEGAISYAKTRGAAFVYCGHTHEATIANKDGIFYGNAGAWTNGSPSYITILGQEVKIHDYVGRVIHCYTSEKRSETAASPVNVAGAPGLPANAGYEYIPGRC
jgi:UDP-2,3-diacylglucosamine pyrophosphatase LpxH